jgi:hypothetical protein
MNDVDLRPDEAGLEALARDVARGEADRVRIAAFFRKIAL